MNCFVGTAALLLIGTPVLAGFIAEDIPDWRGDANTVWYEWESFTSASAGTGPNFPTNEPFPSGQALLFNFGEGAMISGEQNIYGFGGPLNIHAYAYTDSDVQEVVGNISMYGTEMLYDQVMLAWTDGIEGGESGMLFGAPSVNYWEEVDFGAGVGAIANVSYAFDLSGIAADVREIGLFVSTAGPHSSLDALVLDIATIPAPPVAALFALACFGRRRRSVTG
ncbi:MAG: hypothetical protein MK100_05915 [Phycisphaerales bacterium]|nr:hypothetical protein [Phycisphaerales bacterium]